MKQILIQKWKGLQPLKHANSSEINLHEYILMMFLISHFSSSIKYSPRKQIIQYIHIKVTGI